MAEALQLSLQGVLLSLILLSAWGVLFLLYQIIQQQGRLLLGLRAPAGAQPMPAGLVVGTPFAPFKLPDLTGKEVALEDSRSKKTFLVNWSPECGFCDLIAPDLAKLQADLHKRDVGLVLTAYGDGDSNRKLAEEHGLECPILLQKGSQSLEAFQNVGMPVAYLLDEQGRIAQPIAVGAEEVPALTREAANGQPKRKRLPGKRALRESRVEREGIKGGTPAPPSHLPDIYGRTVSLEEYRDRRHCARVGTALPFNLSPTGC